MQLLKSLSLIFFVSLSLPSFVHPMSTTASKSTKLAVHWFRHNDLRLLDNPALTHASKIADCCVPFFCFDSQIFGKENTTPNGDIKCGPRRAQFIRESVVDLQQNLWKNHKTKLYVCHGNPASEMKKLLDHLQTNLPSSSTSVVCQEEVVGEEIAQAKSVKSMLKDLKQPSKLQEIWGSTMYELEELPFAGDLSDMPDTFTPFRNKVEKKCEIPRPLPAPKLKFISEAFPATETMMKIPSLADLGYTPEDVQIAESFDSRSVMQFQGGETAALARVKDYIWTKDRLKVYFDTRNGMLGEGYSTKLSPWLAHGNISPRTIAKECRQYEEERVANKSTYWVIFELLWRDYCKFFCFKHGDRVFFPQGTKPSPEPKKWSTFAKNLEAWKTGNTGYPLVDANMRELAASGFMSNRGRQNVASFLAIDLNHDWRCGGDYFESQLTDYDVYSNWVNWAQAAGVTGGRLNRFNIVKQSKDYDQLGEYVRHWIPELRNVPNQFVHEPWKMTQFQQMEHECKLGVDYPNPIVPPFTPRYQGKNGNGSGKTFKGPPKNKQKQRRPNRNNKHQPYEMKHVSEGHYQIKG